MSDLVARLRAVLEFYADPGSFTKDVPDFYSELDFGAQAQDAIAILTELEGERDTATRALEAIGSLAVMSEGNVAGGVVSSREVDAIINAALSKTDGK